MKNGLFKKSMSVFLSILMLMTCWVWIAPTEAEAASKTVNLSALAAISDGSGDRDNGSRIVICSDGGVGNTTVGNARFSMASIPENASKVTFNLSTGNHGGTLVSGASVKVFLIDPSKCQATSITHAVNNIANVYGSNYNAQQGVTNAYNYYGVTESQALYTFSQNSSSHSFDITNAVNTARANGWSDLCFAFIMPAIYNDGNGNSWSDTHINVSGTNLVCEYEPVGMYYIKYVVNVTDTGDEKDNNLFVSYITNNGQGTLVENETLIDGTQYSWNGNNVTIYEGYINGFPTQLKHHYAFDSALRNERHENFRMYIGSGPDNLTSYSLLSTSGNNWTYNNSNQDNTMPVQSGYDPYQDRISGMTSLSVTVDKNGQGQSLVTTGTVYDQYDVVWYQAPTYTVSSSSTSQVNVSGISAVASGKGAYVKVTDPAALFTSANGYDATTGQLTLYLRATSGSASASVPITITAPKYDVAFNTADGATAVATKTYNYGQALGNTLPVSSKTGYTFNGWFADGNGNITLDSGEDVTDGAGNVRSDLKTFGITQDWLLYSDWTINKYTVTWENEDGTVLETDTDVEYGSTPSYNGATPTKADDGQYTYTFKGWSPEVTEVTDDVTYTAVYEKTQNSFTVTWKFANGTETTESYVYGATPTAPANTASYNDANGHHTYSWPALSEVTGNVTYEETLSTAGHTHGAAATCTTAQTCTVCGEVLVAALGHNFSGAVKANSDYTHSFKCTDCDAYGTGTRADGDATEGGTEACLAHYGDTYSNVTGGENGTHRQQCSVCKQYSAESAHDWDDGEVSKIPSCSEIGEMTYTCTAKGCGATRTTPLDMTAHTWTEKIYDDAHIKTAGTCTAEAVYYYDCAVCDAIANKDVVNGTYTGEKNPDNHTGTADDVKNATLKTCTTDGYTGDTHWSCCDALVAKGTTIPAGHEWGAWTFDATTHNRKCSVCSTVDQGNHSFTIDPQQSAPPAGSSSVFHNYKCEFCDARGASILGNNRVGFGEECFGAGATYTELDENNHTVTCVCGRTKEASHSWNVISEDEATCTTPGSKTSECDFCKAVKTETLPAGHTAGTAVEENLVEATCTTDGSYNLVVRCTVCKKIISSEPKTITAEGHKFSEIVAANAATCAKEGNEAYKTCTVCNKYFAADADVKSEDAKDSADAFKTNIDDANHKNTTAHAETPATCLTVGYTAGTYCDDCNTWISGHEEIPAIAHKNKDHHEKDPATCVATGTIEHWSCPDCGKNFSDEACTTEVTDLTIKMLDHSYTGEIKSDGNGKDKTHSFMCVNGCNEYGAAVAHTWDAGVENPKADCENTGTMTYTCTVKGCGATYTETVNPDGHTLGDWVEEVPATCVATGKKGHYECSVCGKFFAEDKTTVIDDLTLDIDPDAHDIVNHDEKAPTCTEKGWFAYDTCSRCDYTTYVERAPIDHNYGAWTFVADGQHKRVCANDSSHVETEACADADDDTDCNCDKCGELVKHTPAAAVKEEIKDATCGKAGSYNSVVYCSVCKEKLSSTVVEIPATGEHNYGAFAHVENTSTHAKTCSVCGATVTEACTAGDWITDVNATCMEVGSKYKQCTVCKDEMEREGIPMTAHNFGGEIKNSKDGYHVYKCTNILNTNVSCSEYGNEEACSGGAPTCTEKAVCEKCGEEYGSALDHDFATTFTVDKKASCFEAGSKSKHCSRCDATTDVTEIPVRPHNIVDDGIATPATCTTNGVMNQKCNNAETEEYVACDYVTTSEITAEGHKFSETVAANAATCAKEGNEAYKTCTVCNKFFAADAEKMSEAANDSADAFKIDIIADAHDWDEGKVTTEPKCETPGEKTFTCNNDPSHTRTEPVTALGHIDADPVDGKCDRCGTDICKHTDVTKTERKEATCIAEGNIQYWTCDICKKNFSDAELKTVVTDVVIGIDKTNHAGDTYTQDEDIKAGTCISEKTWNEVTYCSDCNAKLGSEAKKGTIDSNNHVGDTYTQDENIVLGTCISEKTWNEVTYCSDCNAKLGTEAKTGSKDADAHKAEAEYIQTIAPTCSAAGEEKLYCEYCDAVLDTREVAIVADAHKAEAEYIQTIAPTCSAVGEEKLYCEYCDAVLDTREVAIVADAHKAEADYTVIKKATCDADGYKAILCEYCDAELSKETIAKREHNLIDVAQTAAPTCTTPGIMSQRCGNVGTDEYEACTYTTTREIAIDANAHDWNNWSVTTPATCVAEGERTRVCKNDSNHVERESIAINKNNHAGLVKVGAKAAACEEIGWDAYEYCTECDYTTYVEIPALEHDYEGVVTKEETCTEDGIITYTCKNDATHTYIEVIPAHHTDADDNGYCDDCNELVCAHTDTRLENVQAVTCLTEGYSGDEICNKCGNEIAKGHAIPATGHNYGEEPFKVINASCTSGKISIYRCDNCHETYSVTDEGEDALGPHTIVEIKEVEPTCDKTGFYVYYCTTCSTNVEVVQIPATGHVDANQDGVCDKVGCGGKVEIPGGSKACSCICHKEGWFMQLIYKIFRFFWKLFGIGKTCDCGFVHY